MLKNLSAAGFLILGMSSVSMAAETATCSDVVWSCQAYCNYPDNQVRMIKLIVSEGKTQVSAFKNLTDQCGSSDSFVVDASLDLCKRTQ